MGFLSRLGGGCWLGCSYRDWISMLDKRRGACRGSLLRCLLDAGLGVGGGLRGGARANWEQARDELV